MGDPEPKVPAAESERELIPEKPAANDEQHKRLVAGYIQLLNDSNLTSRCRAAEALGELGDPAAVEPLIETLMDLFVDVQWLAAKSLGKLGDPRAVGSLIEALRSQENGSGSALHGAGEKFVIHVRSSH